MKSGKLINRFVTVATHNGWTNKETLSLLQPRLQGKAGKITFEELSSESLSNYRKLTKEIEIRFWVIESNKMYQAKFRLRDQKNGEHIQNRSIMFKDFFNGVMNEKRNETALGVTTQLSIRQTLEAHQTASNACT